MGIPHELAFSSKDWVTLGGVCLIHELVFARERACYSRLEN